MEEYKRLKAIAYIHPDYKDGIKNHDIALLKLTTILKCNDNHIRGIALISGESSIIFFLCKNFKLF